MAEFLIIDGTEYYVNPDSAGKGAPLSRGEVVRTFSGRIRTTSAPGARTWAFTTSWMSSDAAETLEKKIASGGLYICNGDAIDNIATLCYVTVTGGKFIPVDGGTMRELQLQLIEAQAMPTTALILTTIDLTPTPLTLSTPTATLTETLRDQNTQVMDPAGQAAPTGNTSNPAVATLALVGSVWTVTRVGEGTANVWVSRGTVNSNNVAVTVPAAAMFKYVPGDSLAIFTTKTRASAATYRDNAGVLQSVGNDVMRDSHYEGPVGAGVRTLLVERGETNYATDFYMTSPVDGTSTAFAASGENGPLPSTNTRLVTSNTNSSSEHWFRQFGPAVVAGDFIATALFAKYRDASCRYLIPLIQPPGNNVTIDLLTGAVSGNAGAYLVHVEPWADGYWRIRVTTQAMSGAGTAQVQYRYAATAGDVGSTVIPAGEGFYATGFQIAVFQYQALCGMPIITTGASASRAADACYRSVAIPVAAMTMLSDYIDRRSWNGPSVDPLFVVGNSSMHGSNRIALGEAGNNVYAQYRSGGVQREFSTTVTPVSGDRIRALGALSGAGAWSGVIKKNNDAEIPGGPVSEPLPGAWDSGVYFMGYAAHRKAVVASGVKTLAEMEAL